MGGLPGMNCINLFAKSAIILPGVIFAGPRGRQHSSDGMKSVRLRIQAWH